MAVHNIATFDPTKEELWVKFTIASGTDPKSFRLVVYARGGSSYAAMVTNCFQEMQDLHSIATFSSKMDSVSRETHYYMEYKGEGIINAETPQTYYWHIKQGIGDGYSELYKGNTLLYKLEGRTIYGGIINIADMLDFDAFSEFEILDSWSPEPEPTPQPEPEPAPEPEPEPEPQPEPDPIPDEEQEDILEVLKIYPREAHISLDWGSHRHNYFNGAFQINRTRIRPRKTYEIVVSGNRKDRDYLVDFYNRHKGAYRKFIFNYDGANEICAFAEKIEVEDCRELQEIVGFEVTLTIEAMQDTLRPITAEEGEYLPLKPFGNVTVHTDWNTNIVDMGKNGRQQTYTEPRRAYSIKLTGHRKHRDAFIEFYRQHGNHVSFLFPYDGEDIEVIFPASIEIEDKLECSQVVGFECELDLEEVRRPTIGALEHKDDKFIYDCIPFLLDWRHIVEVDQYTGKPRGYWTLKSNLGENTQYEFRFDKLVNNNNKIFIAMSAKMKHGAMFYPGSEHIWYDLSTGEEVSNYHHFVDVNNYYTLYGSILLPRDTSEKHISINTDSPQKGDTPQGWKVAYPTMTEYEITINTDGVKLEGLQRRYTDDVISRAIEAGYHLPSIDEVGYTPLEDAIVSSDNTLLCLYRDGLYENGNQIVKFPTNDELTQKGKEYLESILTRFNTNNTKAPATIVYEDGETIVQYIYETVWDSEKYGDDWGHPEMSDTLTKEILTRGKAVYVNSMLGTLPVNRLDDKWSVIAEAYNTSRLGGGRIFDKGSYEYHLGSYYNGTSPKQFQVYYDAPKYDEVIKADRSEGTLYVWGEMLLRNGHIQNYTDIELRHESEGTIPSHYHVYDDTSFSNFMMKSKEVGSGYTVEYKQALAAWSILCYNGKRVAEIYQPYANAHAYYTHGYHLLLDGQGDNWRSNGVGGQLYVIPTDKEELGHSYAIQCFNTRINPIIDMSSQMEKLDEILANKYSEYGLRLEYTPVEEDISLLDLPSKLPWE